MKRESILYLLIMLMSLSSWRGLAQPAEYNMGNNWVFPNAQKYIGSDFVNTASGSFMNDGVVWYSRNFENNGAVNCINPLNSTLNQFTGTAQQHIKGTGITRFYNVLFRNQLITDAFSLEQDVVVAHQADFTTGIVTAVQPSPETMTNMLVFEDGASWVNASDNSYVDGFVRKIGNSAFAFPVGDGGFYRFAGISAPSIATDHFTARYVFANPDLSGYARTNKEASVSQVSNKEYWIVNRTDGSSDVQLTLSWDVNKTSAAVSSDLNKLQIVRWDGSKWVNEGNLATSGGASEGTITANVTGYGVFSLASANHLPVAVDDILVVAENSGVTGNVLTNDSDADSDLLIATQYVVNGTTYPAGTASGIFGVGSVTVYTNGRYSFTPEVGYSGNVSAITYTVSDGNGGTATGNLLITVTTQIHANHLPVAVDDLLTVAENSGVVTGNVLSNDTDVDRNALVVTQYVLNGVTYTGGTAATTSVGNIIVNANGNYTYTPAAGFSGSVPVLTYTVSDGQGGTATGNLLITVTLGNSAPVVTANPVTTPVNLQVYGEVTATDADGDALSFILTSDPAHGTVTVNLNGTYAYTPASDYTGSDSFKITVSDGRGGTTEVTVIVTVEGTANHLPVAIDDILIVAENSGVASGNVLTNDTDADGHALVVTQFVINGVTYLSGTNAVIPGVGNITVNASGSYAFTPATGYSGNVPVLTYAVSDGQGGTATGNLLITVTLGNSAPVVTANPVTTPVNALSYGAVTATDADGDALTFTKTNDPAHGMLYVNLDGTFTYTPSLNYIGTDSFKITVSDGRGGAVTVTVTVTVEEASDCEVFIPNGFSPNGDGIHDYFRITCLDKYENPVIEIYNRWGNLVYKMEHYGDIGFWGSEVKAFWDGKSNQSWSSSKGVLPSGTYYYALKLGNKLKTGSVFISK